MENNIQSYKKSYEAMDKIEQVIMLYETAIASLHQAKEYIAENNIQECYNKTEKAYLIIVGLRDCINTEIGGEVADTLIKWYSDTSLRILSITRNQDTQICDLCINNLKDMKEAWVEAAQISKEAENEKTKSLSNEVENVEISKEAVEASDSISKEEREYSPSTTSSSSIGGNQRSGNDSGSSSTIYSQSFVEGLSLSI